MIHSTHSDHGNNEENELQDEVESQENAFRYVLIQLQLLTLQ